MKKVKDIDKEAFIKSTQEEMERLYRKILKYRVNYGNSPIRVIWSEEREVTEIAPLLIPQHTEGNEE